MTNERALFETTDIEAEAEADARADANVRNGRLISHDAVKRCSNHAVRRSLCRVRTSATNPSIA
jgi:hypothetical protein